MLVIQNLHTSLQYHNQNLIGTSQDVKKNPVAIVQKNEQVRLYRDFDKKKGISRHLEDGYFSNPIIKCSRKLEVLYWYKKQSKPMGLIFTFTMNDSHEEGPTDLNPSTSGAEVRR